MTYGAVSRGGREDTQYQVDMSYADRVKSSSVVIGTKPTVAPKLGVFSFSLNDAMRRTITYRRLPHGTVPKDIVDAIK